MARWVAVLVLTAAAVVVAAPPRAWAHPTLVSTMPEAGYSVSEPPAQVGVVFDEPVTVHFLVVEGQARGRIATTDPETSADGATVTVSPTRPLPDGRYTVRWKITAQDGDVVEGAFGFGVGNVAATTAVDPGSTSTEGLPAVTLLRWALFTGLAVALGGLVGERLVRDRVRRAAPERELPAPRPWLAAGSGFGLLAAVGLALHQVGGGDLMQGLADASVAALVDSDAGRLLAVEVVGFAAAGLAALRPARPLVAAALLVVVAAEGQRSHLRDAAGAGGTVTIAVHLLAVAVWVGALVHVARTGLSWRRQASGQVRALFVAYAFVALGLYVVVAATGTIAAILVLPSVDALVTTTYGRLLIVKLSLVAAASALAVAARRQLRRRPAAGSGSRFVPIARVEVVALVAVLWATALLTAVAPPVDASRGVALPPPVAGPTVRLGTLAGQVTAGIVASQTQLEVRLRTPEWDPAADPGYDIAGTVIGPGRQRTPLAFRPCGAGCFVSPARWRTGDNAVELSVAADEWRGGQARFTVPWPAQDGQPLLERVLAAMPSEPAVALTETVTSDTTQPTPPGGRLQMTGAELIDKQPYRSGVVSAVTILGENGDETEIGFAISAESIYVQITLDPDGLILRERLVSPNHLIDRTYAYP